MKQNPFPVGSVVTWNVEAPAIWRLIWTPGPMTVVAAYWHNGVPSEYALRFGEDGMRMTPGWILTVEYNADDTDYFDPPRSILLQRERLTENVHEKWLVQHTP